MEKTIEIPEGYEARIEGNKVILELKESEDEQYAQRLKSLRDNYKKCNSHWKPGEEVMTMCNQILIDWVKEGKTPEEREQREQAHIRFFELYDEYMERPDVDLEKEIESYLDGFIKTPTRTYFRDTIKHFYELGLNARKEESK